MSFQIKRDFFDRPVVPPYILCKSNKERIGILPCTAKTITVSFNALDEISFTSYLYMDGRKNSYYDEIEVMKYILLPEIGFFAIDSVRVQSEGTKSEHKEVTAKSYECLLGQKYLETFSINMGTTESIDRVQFYNQNNPEKSLLNLALEKCPDWTVGHVDKELITMQRSFEISKQDIYSFLTSDVSEAFSCIFSFDTIRHTVNVCLEKNAGRDTDLCVSYRNLLKNTQITCNVSDIKTCLTLTGENDLNIRSINMGYDKIYNLSYFHSTNFMSQGLYTAYHDWLRKREGLTEEYTRLLSQFQDYQTSINRLTHLKMPDDPNSVDWTEYGLMPLKEKQKAYEQKQDVMIKAGWGDPEHKNHEAYLDIYHTLSEIQKQINVVTAAIRFLERAQKAIGTQMEAIAQSVSMNKNFTREQWNELTSFIREDEFNTNHFVVTDIMTEEERFAMLREFLAYGEAELAKAATPQLSFQADMINLFAVPEFQKFHGEFAPGNYIHITMRDDYRIKARLLSMTVDFYDLSNFSVAFGNLARTGGRMLDVTEVIALAQSAASSVSFHASRWNQAEKEASDIGKMLDEGLLSAGKSITSGENSELVIDSRGIFVNTASGTYAGSDSVFIGGGQILFTDDNWKTVSTSVGRADVTIRGEKTSRFGTFADFVIAGYIGGSTLEGDEIYGGRMQSKNYDAKKSGTLIDLEEGTFEFCANGEQMLSLDSAGNLTVKGTIHTNSGYIGGEEGFAVEDRKLYAGKNAFHSETDGVYIGADGISLGADNSFKADRTGTFYARKGHIDGASSYGSTIDAPFHGTCVGQIEQIAAEQITTERIKTKALEAGFLTDETMRTEYMPVSEWTSSGCIKADRIAPHSIGADRINLNDTPAEWVSMSVVTDVTPIKDENGTVVDLSVSTSQIWFPGKMTKDEKS